MTEKDFGNSQEFDLRDSLPILRQNVGSPSVKEAQIMLNVFSQSIRMPLMNNMARQEKAILNAFIQSEEKTSPVIFCASHALVVEKKLFNMAGKAFYNGEKEQFRLFFDTAEGFNILAALILAEKELTGTGEEYRLEKMASIDKEFGLSESEAMETYLRIVKFDTDLLKFLQKDNSGTSLVNHLSDTIKSDFKLRSDFISTDYLSAGAELARDLYRKMYQIINPRVDTLL